MGKRWHKDTKQFLPADHPLVVAQDADAARVKQAERDAWAAQLTDLCRASAAHQRQRAAEAAAWEERTGRAWPGPR